MRAWVPRDYLEIRLFLPIRKYRTDPRKGRKRIINTQRIFSFPGKSFISALISASRGSRKINRITNRVISIPPPKRNKNVIMLVFVFHIKL
jgi:hypothetical protein